jgi:hypothetical protein
MTRNQKILLFAALGAGIVLYRRNAFAGLLPQQQQTYPPLDYAPSEGSVPSSGRETSSSGRETSSSGTAAVRDIQVLMNRFPETRPPLAVDGIAGPQTRGAYTRITGREWTADLVEVKWVLSAKAETRARQARQAQQAQQAEAPEAEGFDWTGGVLGPGRHGASGSEDPFAGSYGDGYGGDDYGGGYGGY